MIEQPTCTSGRAPLFDFATKPLIVIDRTGQQVKRDVVDLAATLRGETTELGFELRWDVQVHEAM